MRPLPGVFFSQPRRLSTEFSSSLCGPIRLLLHSIDRTWHRLFHENALFPVHSIYLGFFLLPFALNPPWSQYSEYSLFVFGYNNWWAFDCAYLLVSALSLLLTSAVSGQFSIFGGCLRLEYREACSLSLQILFYGPIFSFPFAFWWVFSRRILFWTRCFPHSTWRSPFCYWASSLGLLGHP